MSLPGGKKTKTGAWTTDADVLEDWRRKATSCRARLLDWRQLAKLKGTYTDALPGYIHPETGRVHTSYALAATTTGRLSSLEPNLQNIPVRTEEGRAIRKAFIAETGNEADLAPTTARSSFACSRTSPTSRSCGRPSPTGSTFTP